jgi:hypothetical protein
MASAADRFDRLQKLAIFLIALGQERTREILADVDVNTLNHLNGAMASLGKVTAEEKAAVMLEFAHFFFEDEPLPGTPAAPTLSPPTPPAGKMPPKGRSPLRPSERRRTGEGSSKDQQKKPTGPMDLSATKPGLSDEEQAILHTLDKLRRKVDPGQIDWGKAGYDFGDGFKGPGGDRR